MTYGTGSDARHGTLQKRAKILGAVRHFFEAQDFLEIETPHLVPVPIPEAHIDVVEAGSWVLHPSPEICMKRLLAAGFERIFQICHCWRHGERGDLHLPEFTMLEWYRTEADYSSLMVDCENLVKATAAAIGLENRIHRYGQAISLDGAWERLTVHDAFSRYGGMTVDEALERDLFDEVMVCAIEPKLGSYTPTFLLDYPASRGSLARLKTGRTDVVERFELYIGGLEIANAFSELVNAEEQHARFIHEQDFRQRMDKPVYPLPEKFLSELSNMPPSAGIALGIDRLVMLLVGADTIDEVVAFTPEEL